MRQIAFYGIGAYEREPIAQTDFPGYETLRFSEPLDSRTVEGSPDAEVVSVFIQSAVTEDVLARLPKLRLVSTRSTGYDHIDLEACRRRGIAVSHVPSYGEQTVAEHAFALVFALAKKLPQAFEKTRHLDFSLSGLEGFELKGKTFGVVGAGRIGVCALRIARALGMETLACDLRQVPEIAEREGFRYVALDELLERSDVVSIHAVLDPETYHLIDREGLRRMKPSALLINTARGGIVDSEALCEALKKGWIAGAGLDVMEGETLIQDEAELLHRPLSARQLRELSCLHALLRQDNVLMTPHSAFFTREGVARLIGTSLENVRAFLAGRPQNLVFPLEASGRESPRRA